MRTRDALFVALTLLFVALVIGEFLIWKIRTARGPQATLLHCPRARTVPTRVRGDTRRTAAAP
jgi:hypothetical protein